MVITGNHHTNNISTRAPPRGKQCCLLAIPVIVADFNPRSPRGERQQKSINKRREFIIFSQILVELWELLANKQSLIQKKIDSAFVRTDQMICVRCHFALLQDQRIFRQIGGFAAEVLNLVLVAFSKIIKAEAVFLLVHDRQ